MTAGGEIVSDEEESIECYASDGGEILPLGPESPKKNILLLQKKSLAKRKRRHHKQFHGSKINKNIKNVFGRLV